MALSVLETVKKSAVKNARAIAVLGDMRELGEYSSELHKKVGRSAAGKADFILTLGSDAVNIAEGALEARFDPESVFMFASDGTDYESESDKLVKRISEIMTDGDVLLFKASRAVALEETVKKIFG